MRRDVITIAKPYVARNTGTLAWRTANQIMVQKTSTQSLQPRWHALEENLTSGLLDRKFSLTFPKRAHCRSSDKP